MARRLRLRLSTAPARVSPGSEAYYVDKADGHLKSKNSAGVIVDHDGGVALNFRLLGPFTLNFDTPNIENGAAGVTLWSAEVGDILIDCWVRVITNWNSDASVLLDIATLNNFDSLIPGGVQVSNFESDHREDAFSDLGRRFAGLGDFGIQAANAGVITTNDGSTLTFHPRLVPAHFKVATDVIAYVQRGGSVPTAGQVLVYAIVANPAA